MNKFWLLASILIFSAPVWSHEDQEYSRAKMQEEYTGKGPAKVSTDVPEELKNVGIEEKIGQKIDLTAMVKNEAGQMVPLSSFFKTHQPVIFSPVYFSCPGLCNFHLNGLTETLKEVNWSPGKQFQVVAFSFDPKETPELASKKKESYLKAYGRVGTDDGWHFVTADQPTIDKITSQVGFKYKWNPKLNEWAHASAAIVMTPEGTISEYLHGIQFEARDVKLALNDASNGKIGNIVETVMLYCFKNNPQSQKGLQVFRVMKIGAAVSAVLLLAWLIPFLIRTKRENT